MPETIVVPYHLQERLRALHDARNGALPKLRLAWVHGDGRVGGKGLQDAQVLFRYFPRDEFPTAALTGEHMLSAVEQLPSLRWIHVHAAGVDDQPLAELEDRGLTLTNSVGVMDTAVAEMAVSLLLAAAKQLPAFARLAAERRWERRVLREVGGATAAVIGLGGIGLQVALRCRALGMRVLAVKRSPQRLPRGADGLERLPVEELHGLEGLKDVLSQAEYVVLCASLNPSSRQLIDEIALQAMRRDAYLINVGRGGLVDEEALRQALRAEAIAGAFLDVVVDEPIPADSPWYDTPNCFMTPHNALKTTMVTQRLCGFFLDNLTRFLQGAPLENVVIGSAQP